MADKQVKVVIAGEDKTGGAFKSASKNVSVLNKDVSGLAKVLGGGLLTAGAGLTAFLYSAAKGAGEAQASMARVDSILNTMGASALKNRDALLEQANAAVKLGFDDEAAAESLARFYQRTNDLTEATKLNTLAMDLARAKNIDLDSASRSVGMALAGNARVLKEFGIELEDGAGKLEIINALQEKVGGTAENVAGSFQVQMQVISESVSNLKDTIGAAILEAIAPFIKQLSDWASNPDVQRKMGEIAKVVGEFATEVMPIVIETLRLWYHGWKNVVDEISNVIVFIQQVIDKVGEFDRKIQNSKLVKGIQGTVKGAISEIKYLSGARADGGPVSAGGSYLVGERGPEIFTPSRSGSIIPNMATGGGGIVINVSNNTLLDDNAGKKIGDQIMRSLKGNLRI